MTLKTTQFYLFYFFIYFWKLLGLKKASSEKMYTHMYLYVHTYTWMYTHIYICMYTHVIHTMYTHTHMYVYDLFIISGYSQAPWNSLKKPILRTSNQISEESEIHRIYTTCQKLKYMLKTPRLLLHPLFSSVPQSQDYWVRKIKL